MAFSPVTMPQVLWKGMGVAALYYPGGVPKADNFHLTQAPVKNIFSGAVEKTAANRQPSLKPKAAPKSSPTPPLTENVEKAKEVRSGQPRPFAPLVPELWPDNWQKQLMGAKRGKIAWTYWKLANDLSGVSSKEEQGGRRTRSALLQRMFRELAMPVGTHTFWPAALPDKNGELKTEPAVFWSGILELNCRGVVILGSEAAYALLTERKIQPLDELRMAGKMVWVLRDPDALAGNESWYALALSLLRNAFRTHIR